MTTVRTIKQDMPHIGKGLWKLSEETIEWPPYVNRIRKLLVDIAKEMENTNNKKIDIWTRAKNLIKTIGIEETNNRRKQIQKAERLMRTKLGKEIRSFKDTIAKRQEIEKLTRRIDESKGTRIMKAQKTAKAKYTKEGQKNTKYFFNLNKNRHDPLIITGLINKNGKLVKDTKTMCKVAAEYHKELQKPPQRELGREQKINTFLQTVTQSTEEDDILMLEKNTTAAEVRKAIKSCKNGTAPGIDGIPYEFFKFWLKKYEEYKDKESDPTVKEVKDIAEILVKVYNEIENEELYNDNFVLGTMNLLYKKKDRQRIENYRPITLTNTDYKIYTKTIAEKLGKIAHKIIHQNQAGFIPGRNIHNHTRLTRSMIHYCKTHQKNGYILSLDQEKAYDKIAHDYLWKSLEKYGLPQKFIQKIQKLYKKARTVVSVNKMLPQAIKIGRGVRQGCPMSCLLYDIAIEPLAETI